MTTIEFKMPRIVCAKPRFAEPCGDGWDFLAENDAFPVDAELITGKLFITFGGSFYAERTDGKFFYWERI